jgi:hypothetical protein
MAWCLVKHRDNFTFTFDLPYTTIGISKTFYFAYYIQWFWAPYVNIFFSHLLKVNFIYGAATSMTLCNKPLHPHFLCNACWLQKVIQNLCTFSADNWRTVPMAAHLSATGQCVHVEGPGPKTPRPCGVASGVHRVAPWGSAPQAAVPTRGGGGEGLLERTGLDVVLVFCLLPALPLYGEWRLAAVSIHWKKTVWVWQTALLATMLVSQSVSWLVGWSVG